MTPKARAAAHLLQQEGTVKLSDQCYLDGCDKAHYRIASHIDCDGHRKYYCSFIHQEDDLKEMKRQQQQAEMQRRERAARMIGA